MPKFVHIDIATDDPERAAGFYEKVFGWGVRKLEGPVPYWLKARPMTQAHSVPESPKESKAGSRRRQPSKCLRLMRMVPESLPKAEQSSGRKLSSRVSVTC